MIPIQFAVWARPYTANYAHDYYSLKVDETVYASPWNPGHIPDYSHLEPIEPRDSAWDRRSGQCVVWVHEDQALADVLAAAKERAQNPRPKQTTVQGRSNAKGNKS